MFVIVTSVVFRVLLCGSAAAGWSSCAAGLFDNDGTGCRTCPVGHYCPTGTDLPIPCPSGTYNAITGTMAASDCIVCAAGTYTNTSGSTTCATCPAGMYCSSPGLAAPTAECRHGTYSPGGATACTVCPLDHYCTTASTSPKACPTGYYAPQGASSCTYNVTGTVYCQCHEGWTRFQAASCYRSFTTEYSFQDAEAKCKEVDAHIVRIETAQENKFLEGFLAGLKAPLHWIGLSRDMNDTWQWGGADMTAPSFTSWEAGRPARGSRAHCAVIWSEANTTSWLDEPCVLHLPPICEKKCGVIPVLG